MFKIKALEKLKSGSFVYDLSKIVEEDFIEAQTIADNGKYTECIHVETVYKHRIDNSFIGTYECYIDDVSEYNAFIDALIDGYSTVIPVIPDIDQWRQNKILINGKNVRLAKWMLREGIDQTFVDWYSRQKKTGKQRMYLTISDLPQHIIGMSYYASDWTSCMHPDREDSIMLVSSLHDDSLLIGFIHNEIDDLYNLDSKMLARVQMRIVEHDSKQILIPSRIYGNDTNQCILNRCLCAVSELGIMNKEVRFMNGTDDEDERMTLVHGANGHYSMYVDDDVHVLDSIDEYIDIDCIKCGTSGKYDVSIGQHRLNIDVSVPCPYCDGTGKQEIRVKREVNEIIQVSEHVEIKGYHDDYEHHGDRIEIDVHRERLEEMLRSL